MKVAVLAVEGVAQPDGPVVQRAGNHDDFESGPGSAMSAITRLRRASAGGAGIVRVEVRQRRHGQDFARARANHDARNADGRVLLHRLGQRRFDDVLNHRINRQHHIEAVARLDVLLAQCDQLPPAAGPSRSAASRARRPAWN